MHPSKRVRVFFFCVAGATSADDGLDLVSSFHACWNYSSSKVCLKSRIKISLENNQKISLANNQIIYAYLRVLYANGNLLNRSTKIKLFKSFILPHFISSDFSIGSASVHFQSRMRIALISCIRFVFNIRRSLRTCNLCFWDTRFKIL